MSKFTWSILKAMSLFIITSSVLWWIISFIQWDSDLSTIADWDNFARFIYVVFELFILAASLVVSFYEDNRVYKEVEE